MQVALIVRRGNEGNKKQFLATMDAVEKALGHYEGPWFMQQYGLVDITFVPFLERIVASIPYYKVCSCCFVMGMHENARSWRKLVHSSSTGRSIRWLSELMIWVVTLCGSSPRRANVFGWLHAGHAGTRRRAVSQP